MILKQYYIHRLTDTVPYDINIVNTSAYSEAFHLRHKQKRSGGLNLIAVFFAEVGITNEAAGIKTATIQRASNLFGSLSHLFFKMIFEFFSQTR